MGELLASAPSMAARSRIGFVDLSTIEDRSASSGVPFNVAAALEKWCGEVVELGLFPASELCPLRHQRSERSPRRSARDSGRGRACNSQQTETTAVAT